MRFSINCSTVICSPTVILMLSWEKPLVKPMAPGSILIISISITLFTCFAFTFYFASLYQKYQKYYLIISIRSHSRKWPCRDWQPLIALVARIYLFCVGARDSRVASYWIDTLVLKNWGKYLRYYCCITLSSSRKTNASSRSTRTHCPWFMPLQLGWVSIVWNRTRKLRQWFPLPTAMDRAIHEEHLGLETGGGHVAHL